MNTNIDYTKKIYNQLLLQFKGAAYIGKNDEDYLFNPLPFTHVSDISILNGQGSQKVTNDFNMITGSSGIKLMLSKFLFESELGLTGLNLSSKNSFYAIDS